jgi:hypothetical protein
VVRFVVLFNVCLRPKAPLRDREDPDLNFDGLKSHIAGTDIHLAE